MRIAEIITKPERGGAQTHVYELLSGLKSRIEFHLLTGSEGFLTEECRRMGIRHHVLPELRRDLRLGNDLRALGAVRRIIRRIAPDLIHAHTAKAGVVGRLCGWSLSIPTVYSPHGFSFSGRSNRLLRVVSWAVEAGLRTTNAGIIAVSRFEHDLAIRSGVAPRRSVHLIPNGISDAAAPADPGRPGRAKVVMIARFGPPKDHETLVRACSLIPDPFELVLIGDGPLRGKTEELVARLGLRKRVRFTGECSDVDRELASAQIVVLSSRSEAMPLCLLEGMRAGLPVVATNAEGMKELVVEGETGLLTEPGDPAGLAAALQSLLANPDLRMRMGRSGRRRFEAFHEATEMVNRIESLYRSIVYRRGTGAKSDAGEMATQFGNSG